MRTSFVTEAADYLKLSGFGEPRIGFVLGTGLNSLVNEITDAVAISFNDIPHFVTATVEFHKGQLIFGKIHDVPVVAMQGRFHYYEGYTMQQITFPVRVMKELGIEYLLLSNAAGGMNLNFEKGDLVIIEDHINLLPDNPLRGLDNAFGNKFVDMSEPYNAETRKRIESACAKENITIKRGTYVSVMGPNLETKAEYRWLKGMGADMVGMSTVPEVIIANQIGLKCAAISVITDVCDPDNLKPINIAEIIEVAGQADKKLTKIFCAIVAEDEKPTNA